MTPLNAFTVDVEDWYHATDLGIPIPEWNHYEDRVDANTRRILDLMDEYGAKGTFFVLGCVGQKFPELVREIAERGHEVGSHGGWHRMLGQLTHQEFEEDVLFSKKVLEDAAGAPVQAFRAPVWSITPARYDLLEVLEQLGFTCDSSIQPFRTPLSGIKNAPRDPFRPVLRGRRLNLVEYPSTVASVAGQAIPFSGGLYLRVLPTGFLGWALRRVNQERNAMVYTHPWEVDPDQPMLARSPLIRFTHYYNLRSTVPKLRAFLAESRFITLSQLIAQEDVPDLVLS